MATTKPSHNNQDSGLRWYQVPVLWICAGIFIFTLIACAHLILLSTEKAAVLPSENHSSHLFLLTTSATENQDSSTATRDDER